jgi:hypothetical protein
MRVRSVASGLGLIVLWGLAGLAPQPSVAADPRLPVAVMEDNSFFIEEAYNQEAGVVQHIFNAQYETSLGSDPNEEGWTLQFTQEWPVFSERHQFSYDIPVSLMREGSDHQYGLSDIQLNYRFQALDEAERIPAFAPRFSLILPTGSRDKQTGDGVVGYQWNLPFSKVLAPRLATHLNLGLTYLPGVRIPLDDLGGHLSPSHSLVNYNLGTSVIFALTPRFNFLVEWIGTFEEGIGDDGGEEGSFSSFISPGFRAAVVNRDRLQIVMGAAAPIGLTTAAPDYGVFLYLSVEHNFL